MSNLTLTGQDFINYHPSADAIITEYPCIGPSDHAPHSLMNPFQFTGSDVSYASCIPSENVLGLYETCGPESDDWAVNLLGYSPATSTSNQTDTEFFNTLFFSHSDSLVRFGQPPATHRPFVSETALSGVGDNFAPHTSQTLTLAGSLLGPKRTVRSLRERVSASRLLSRSPSPRESSRHTPYPVGPDRTIRSNSPASMYQCQWFDGSSPCGAAVQGTKHAIGEHLHSAHAIRLKADKTSQVCRWDGCRKSMRKESIARHILAVHMQDKVLCPSCGSRFARTDSLQRHQRTQCVANREASDACKVGK